MSSGSFVPPSARGGYLPMKVVENVKASRTKELFKTKSKASSNLDKSYPESEEEDSIIIKVRCPECGNTLAYINLVEYEGPIWKRFLCKKCRNTLPVSINPAIIQRSELNSKIHAKKVTINGFI